MGTAKSERVIPEERVPMKTFALSGLAAVSLSFFACDNNFDNKPAAEVGSQSQAATQAEPKASNSSATANHAVSPVSSLKVDSSASTIGWVGAKVTGKHEGSFKEFVGSADIRGDQVQGFAFEVQTASIDSDTPKLTGHLKSPDFFDVQKYPKATFKTSRLIEKSSGANTHEISGDLTLREVTKSISFPAAVKVTPKAVSGTAEFTINRKDFGLEYPGMKDDLIKDDVLLKLSLVFPRD